ncbi:MAG TPA: sigma-54 dependent transcriptional regulator [Desulfobacterales bacterium]|nr:sigma-54 dependent transcriptional regulator [Desulfobacterales bacterium]
MIQYSIYIVDDEESIREGVTMALEEHYEIDAFPTAESAIDAIKANLPDLVLLDIGLPGMDGMNALREIKDLHPDVLVIMITAYEDIASVISAMKLGAYDYVVKPIHMDSLEMTIRNALETIRLRKEVQLLQERYLRENLPCFISESNAIQNVMAFIEMVAKSPDTPILILGETGTGKELIASAIHYRSPNFKGPFMTVNCAAIPKDLIESELFGYEKGAFSGAGASGKKGLIEEAANGTLFLDEVGDLSLEAQAKLLRFLEMGEFYRVGGTKKLQIETRIVSATNKDLDSMIEKGLFRKDLYFRVGVIKVQAPSLNERRGDIMPLAKHFLMEFSNKFGKAFTDISANAENALMTHNWTGHVRELKNLIEKGVLVGEGPMLEVEDLGLGKISGNDTPKKATDGIIFPPLPAQGIDLAFTQESLEKYYIEEAFRMAEGNESRAARLLNMNHHTFRYRRKKLQNK